MRFLSTAGKAPPATFAEAVWRGLAPDGGLYVPETVPALPAAFWSGLADRSLPALLAELLLPFAGEDLGEAALREIAAEALDFPIPLVQIEEGVWIAELFHGPTLAFKDLAARFLARALPRLGPARRDGRGSRATVLVATSGDTGAAVAHAFHGVPGTRAVVLYPRGQVSPLQERQMATLGGNVVAASVDGTFDDCQRLVKDALADRKLAAEHALTSANSINVGRLLPQMAFYAHAAARLPRGLAAPVFAVPSGNLGNLAAGLLAERMGLPVRRFVAAANANRALPDFLETGRFTPRAARPTLANAMDVGNPSNLARIRALFADDLEAIRRRVWASAHEDEAIRGAIAEVFRRTGRVLDPHTAVGYLALRRYLDEADPEAPAAVLLSTAHPAKFPEVVEPLIGRALPQPPALAACRERPLRTIAIPAEASALRRVLETAAD
jgi:threonine synthase